jgi:hypothetical protein
MPQTMSMSSRVIGTAHLQAQQQGQQQQQQQQCFGNCSACSR